MDYHVRWWCCFNLPGPLEYQWAFWSQCMLFAIWFVKKGSLRGGFCTFRRMESGLIGLASCRGELTEQPCNDLFPPWSCEAFREAVRDLIQSVGISCEYEQVWKFWALILQRRPVLHSGMQFISSVFFNLEGAFEFKQLLNNVVILVEGDGWLLKSFFIWPPNFLVPWLWSREFLLTANDLQDKMFSSRTCDTCVDPCVRCTDLLNLHIRLRCYGEMLKANQGPSILQPLDVALANVTSGAAKDHSCPG